MNGAVLLGRYRIADRERFLEVFDGFAPARAAAGALTCGLVAEGPHTVLAVIEFADAGAARAFAESAARRDALRDAGVLDREDKVLESLRPLAPAAG